MKNEKLILFFIFFIFFVYITYMPQYPYQSNQYSLEELPASQNSVEMQNLINFLKKDQTDKINYYKDPHRGVDYFVCTSFTRELAKNANDYGIKMGAVSLRDTMKVGEGTRYYHAMNYCIIDGRFIIIEPITDEIFTLEELRLSDYSIYKYISIYQNAQMMTNYGKGKQTIDIYIYSGYDGSEIVNKFPPQ